VRDYLTPKNIETINEWIANRPVVKSEVEIRIENLQKELDALKAAQAAQKAG